MPTYIQVQLETPLVPIEKQTPNLIRYLQSRGLLAMGLTARSLPLVERTIEQLSLIDVDFTRNSLYDHEIYVTLDFPALYKHGVFYCSDNCKGQILLHFFDNINYHPKKIIFVDDKMKNIKAVEKYVEEKGIEFVGLRYGAADERVANFDPVAAEVALQEFLEKH